MGTIVGRRGQDAARRRRLGEVAEGAGAAQARAQGVAVLGLVIGRCTERRARAHTRQATQATHRARGSRQSSQKRSQIEPKKNKTTTTTKTKRSALHTQTHTSRERERERERLSRMLLPVSPCSRRRKTRFKARRLV